MRAILSSLLITAVSVFAGNVSAQTELLTEGFDDDTFESNFEIMPFENPDDPDGFQHFWEVVDYSSFGIPPAPSSSDGSTTGLQIFTNIGGFNTADVVNFYTQDAYTGNLRVSVDVYLNFVPETSGTTENFSMGIFHEGDKVISWEGFVFAPDGNDLPNISDGYFYSMNSDGDSGSRGDYLFSEGFPNGSSGADFLCGTWEAANPAETISDCRVLIAAGTEENDAFFLDLFPPGDGVNPATAGNRWVTVVMEYIDGTITVSLNGTVVHTYTDPDTTFTEGKVLLSHEDPFGSNGEGNTFGVWDNLVIEQLESTSVENWSVLQ